MPKRGNRWYDRYPPLAHLLEQLKECDRVAGHKVIKGLRDIIATDAPGLIDRTALEYPLDAVERRRWYDSDPISWLTINALSQCDEDVIFKAVAYLRASLRD
jgi:hypothetical protein